MRRALASLLCCAAAGAGGCGLGPGEPQAGGASLLVTDRFGLREVGRSTVEALPADETPMRQLQRSFEVQTRYGGGFVQAIEGLAGGRAGGRQIDWFYYLNGVEASQGAAATDLSPGDRVWWDRHDWGAAMRIPAVVGQFPAPFVSRFEGKRLPVRLDCGAGAQAACDLAARRLSAAGIAAGRSRIGNPSEEVLKIVVGLWPSIRSDLAARQLEAGPSVSGVYARVAKDGSSITVLDERGRPARTLKAGGGLIAATVLGEERPTWVLTGTDAAGLQSAAEALEEGVLQRRFALAIDRGTGVPAPLVHR